MLEAIILGIVQGITEFLPISSTAHLVILPWFFKWGKELNSLTFDVALHAGTLASLLICLRKDISKMFKKEKRLMFLIIIGTLPAVGAGLKFHHLIEDRLRSPMIIAATLVAFGVLMLLAERFKGEKDVKGVTFFDAIFIGIAQAVALIPGVSRSGVTITAGLMRNVKRHEAARFSFLLSIPAICGAIVLEGRKLVSGPHDYDLSLFFWGFLSSMITGIVVINFLLKYLRRHKLNIFVYYRFLLAGLIVGWVWLR